MFALTSFKTGNFIKLSLLTRAQGVMCIFGFKMLYRSAFPFKSIFFNIWSFSCHNLYLCKFSPQYYYNYRHMKFVHYNSITTRIIISIEQHSLYRPSLLIVIYKPTPILSL